VDDFYAARDTTTAPLPWPSIAPPFTLYQAGLQLQVVLLELFSRITFPLLDQVGSIGP
jgi:hypothetical protein